MTNAWTGRDARREIEDAGAWCRSQAVAGWAFRVRRECPWNGYSKQALFRLACEPDIAAYLERVREPSYVATAEDLGIDARLARRAWLGGHLAEWSGVYGRDGRPLAMTEDAADALFEHFPDVLAELQAFARDGANYIPRGAVAREAIAMGN